MTDSNEGPYQPAGSFDSEPTRARPLDPAAPIPADETAAPSSTKDQVKSVASNAGDRVGGVASTAQDEAGAVKDTAKSAGADVVESVKQQAGTVVDEAKTQSRRLVDEGLAELRTQAGSGQQRLAEFVHSLTGELESMSQNADQNGLVAGVVNNAQRIGHDTAEWLERHGPDDVVAEVRRYAARKPFAFLAISAGVGFVGARLLRGLQAANSDPTDATRTTQPQLGQPQYGGVRPSYGTDRADADLAFAPVEPQAVNPLGQEPWGQGAR